MYTAIDLFSGCGGMALGFKRAGFRIVGAIEADPRAAETFAANLLKKDLENLAGGRTLARDITEYTCAQFHRDTIGTRARRGVVDLIIAGPPCQAFARIGRAKLREVMNDPSAYLNDHRASLYTNLLAYVEFYHPLAVVLENVPDFLNHGQKNVAEELAVSLEDLGYEARYTLLNAAHYGVPQLRTRLFLIALSAELGVSPSFPRPTHHIELPRGHRDYLRAVTGEYSLFSSAPSHYVDPPVPASSLPPAVSVGEAIGDLPPITWHVTGDGAHDRSTAKPSRYRSIRPSNFASAMREWPGFRARDYVSNHVIRCLPRDHPIFRRMAPGDDYRAALRIAETLLEEALKRDSKKKGRALRRGSTAYERIVQATVPPYDVKKFRDRWRKLEPGRPSHTLTAHLGKDSYTHIHYDSAQARVISVREAARLQSFPDGFMFPESMNAALHQIGNAVPPLVAYAIGREVRRMLERAESRRR